jgi:hypothetical protein
MSNGKIGEENEGRLSLLIEGPSLDRFLQSY